MAEPQAQPLPTAKGEVTVLELTRAQEIMARRVAETKATVPEFALRALADAAPARAATAAAGATLADAVVHAAARALRDVPRGNGAYRDNRWELYGRVNVGLAMAADEALTVPTVFDADVKSLAEIAAETRGLGERVLARTIRPPELAGQTFTVLDLGAARVASFQAILNGGQAAVLAVGAVREAPVVRDGAVAPGEVVELTLTCDHRILFGAVAGELLDRIVARLEGL
ncbi:MAG TPA: 2-oxo acid dehydrogenase subunit E2 [Solirubrobacteraceae bacterium]